MSYTITEPSNTYLPGENITWFEALSSEITETSYSYRYRLQITGVDDTFTTGTTGSDVVGTFRTPPRPITGVGTFSPMAIAKNYVTTPLDLTLQTPYGATSNGVGKLRIIYGQEYVDPSTGLTGLDSATGGTFYFWDSVILDQDFPTYSQTEYVVEPVATGASANVAFLTDGPATRCIYDYDYLYALVGSGAYNSGLDVDDMLLTSDKAFQSGGTLAEWDSIVGQGSNVAWTWTTIGGAGIQPSASITNGSFSVYLTYNQSTTGDPYRKLGPVGEGDQIEIRLRSNTNWVNVNTSNELWLVGLQTGGTGPIPIVQFQEYERALNNTVLYEIGLSGGAYYATTDYDYLGFAYKNVGEANRLVVQFVETWSYIGKSAYWNITDTTTSTSTRIAVDAEPTEVRLAYLNTGTDAEGIATGFTVYLEDYLGNRLTEIITYSPDNCNNCSGCDKKQIMWLNSLGGYDSYEFNCLTQAGLDVTRQLSERTLPIGYIKGQRGRQNPANVASTSRTVTTQYIGQEITDWMESLLMSPNAYEVQTDGSLIPIQINDNSFSTFVRQDKIKLTQFTYTLAYNRKSQIL